MFATAILASAMIAIPADLAPVTETFSMVHPVGGDPVKFDAAESERKGIKIFVMHSDSFASVSALSFRTACDHGSCIAYRRACDNAANRCKFELPDYAAHSGDGHAYGGYWLGEYVEITTTSPQKLMITLQRIELTWTVDGIHHSLKLSQLNEESESRKLLNCGGRDIWYQGCPQPRMWMRGLEQHDRPQSK